MEVKTLLLKKGNAKIHHVKKPIAQLFDNEKKISM